MKTTKYVCDRCPKECWSREKIREHVKEDHGIKGRSTKPGMTVEEFIPSRISGAYEAVEVELFQDPPEPSDEREANILRKAREEGATHG